MSYQEKRTLVNILSGVPVFIAYGIYVFVRIRSGSAEPNDLRFWGITMLTFIGIGVASGIILQILFHIGLSISIAIKTGDGKEREVERDIEATIVEDEMDKLIELKSLKLGFSITGTGFVIALIYLAFSGSAAGMLNIMFFSFGIGSISEGFLSLRYYRKGLKNG
ncbi:MAG: hypothetical protein KBC39_08015 [Thermotogae bacterium]|nr:hypothetical protein [Thermotogota bacterium]MDD8041083.1 hypothetical protein [Thermotogota bacterium]